MKLRLPHALTRLITLCATSCGITFASGSASAAPDTSFAAGECRVVWKPAPEKATQEKDTLPPQDDEEKGAAPTLAALGEGEPLLDEFDLNEPADLAAIPVQEAPSDRLVYPHLGDGVQFVRVSDGKGGEKWLFVLGKGEELDITPDDTTWAFWNRPEGYDHDFFETLYLHDGYSAVWVTAKHRLYVPVRMDDDADEEENNASSSTNGNNTTTTTSSSSSSSSASAPGASARFCTGVSLTRGVFFSSVASSPVTKTMEDNADTTPYTWTTGQTGTLSWGNNEDWGTSGIYTANSPVTFSSNGNDSPETTTVTLCGEVGSGTFKMTGEDNYTFNLDNNELTLNGKLEQTGTGTLKFESGSFQLNQNYTINAQNIEFNSVAINDANNNETGGNTVIIGNRGTFKMNGGNGDIVKINAYNAGASLYTVVELTNGAKLDITRNNDAWSGLETLRLIINESQLSFEAAALKAHMINVSGSGSTLTLARALQRLDAAYPSTTLTLENGAKLSHKDRLAQLDLTEAVSGNFCSPTVNLVSSGNTSPTLDGNWKISQLTSLEIKNENAYLTLDGGLAISSNFALKLWDLALPDGEGTKDYTIFKLASGSLTINDQEFQTSNSPCDLSTLCITAETAGSLKLNPANNYYVTLVRIDDYVKVRVLHLDYTWDHSQGATMSWAGSQWNSGNSGKAYYSGASVKFENDTNDTVDDTVVSLTTDVTTGNFTVEGKDNFTFRLDNSNKLTLNGDLTQTGDGHLKFAGGSFEISEGKTLTAKRIEFEGVTISDKNGPGTGVNYGSIVTISDGGTFKMDGGSGELVKINANKAGVELTNGAKLGIKRENALYSGFEANTLNINGKSSLTINGAPLKAGTVTIDNSTLSLAYALQKLNSDVTSTTLTLQNGAKLSTSGTLSLTDGDAPDVQLVSDGTSTSYLEGNWTISKLTSLEVKDVRACLTLKGKLEITSDFDLKLSYLTGASIVGNHRIFQLEDGGSLKLKNGALEDGDTYDDLTTLGIRSVTVQGGSALDGYNVSLSVNGNGVYVNVSESGYVWRYNGQTMAWTSTTWDGKAYTPGSDVAFKTDWNAEVQTSAITVGSGVVADDMSVSGEDNFTFDLSGGGALTINGKLTQTDNGTLSFENGTVTFKAGDNLIQNVEFKNATIEDNTSQGTIFVVGDGGTLKLNDSSASIWKINASNGHQSTETHVILDNGAVLNITRDTNVRYSGLETAHLEILGGSTLEFQGKDSLKAEHITVSGSNSKLILKNSLLKPQSGAGENDLIDEVDLTLADGATLRSANSGVLDLSGAEIYNPTLNLVLQGTSSTLSGAWAISKLGSIELKDAGAALNVDGSLNLKPEADFNVTLHGTAPVGYQDYTLFRFSNSNALTIDGQALREYVDYFADSRISGVMVNGTNLKTAGGYDLQLYNTGDSLLLRVISDSYVRPAAYTWNNGKSGELAWSFLDWGNEAVYTAGADVSFVSDGVGGAATTKVTLKTNVKAGAMTVSGEDHFTFALGGHIMTADSVDKSDSGTLTLQNGTLATERLDISGGTVAMGAGASLSGAGGELEIALSGGATLQNAAGGTLDPSGSGSSSALRLVLQGESSPTLSGAWEISRLKSIELRNTGAALDVTGSLNLASAADFDVFLPALSGADYYQDYTLFTGAVTINGDSLAEYKDYSALARIGGVTAGGVNLSDSAGCKTCLIKSGDALVLRVVSQGHDYTWSDGELAWSDVSWGDGAYFSGADASFDGTGNKTVNIKDGTNAGTIYVSGSGDVTFNVGGDVHAAGLNISSNATIAFSGQTLDLPQITVAGQGVTSAVPENVRVQTITVADGAGFTLDQPLTAIEGAEHTELRLENGATLTHAGSDARALNTLCSGLANILTLSGSASTLEGDWVLAPALATTLRYTGANTEGLNISRGSLNIANAAITLDLSGVWDGMAPVSQRILGLGVDGTLTGLSTGDGIPSLFQTVYIRYGSGENDIFKLTSDYKTVATGLACGLSWDSERNELYFKAEGTYAYLWRHDYGEALTWQTEREWRNGTNYANGSRVFFLDDFDGAADNVAVTIVGTVAPGESSDGTPGITVSGEDNFEFTGGADAKIADILNGEETVSHTSIVKSGGGTLTIAANIELAYTGRTEVLGGKMVLLGTMWAPAGTLTVAQDATLQIGPDEFYRSLASDLQSNRIDFGTALVSNNGTVLANIVRTTGSEVLGDGLWHACYFLLEHSNFHAGSVELPYLREGLGNSSMVVNNSNVVLSGHLEGEGQNLTIMNRGFLTVEGSQGKAASCAAAEVKSAIITGEGSGMAFTGGGTLRAEKIDLTYGATLSLCRALEHVDNKPLTLTLGFGSTLHNNTDDAIVINPNANAGFVQVMKATDAANYYEGNWTLDLSHPFELDLSYFDLTTTAVPMVIREGTFTFANGGSSFNKTTETSNFALRLDGLRYDTVELMGLDERGVIAFDGTAVVNNANYIDRLDSLGYWFHERVKADGTTEEVGWTYVDLIKRTKLADDNSIQYLTEQEFRTLTGLSDGLTLKLLFENNTLSLVLAQETVKDNMIYRWTGLDQNGNPYNTWTRNNSTSLSPWEDNEIFRNGFPTVFDNTDSQGNMVANYTVEVENSVATGSKAGIVFQNRCAYGYIIQSEAYNGSGCIADISDSDLTTVTVEGGYVEFKTSNTYGGKLVEGATTNYTTQIRGKFVTGAEDLGTGLRGKNLSEARAAGLVGYTQYTYAYIDINDDGSYGTEIHYVSEAEYNDNLPNPDPKRKYEQLYAIQSADGSWLVRGEVIPVQSASGLVMAYKDGEQYYAYVYTTGEGDSLKYHFVNEQDYADHAYPDGTTRIDITWDGSNWKHGDKILGQTYIETVVETNRVFGYAYYDSEGQLHFTTKSAYEAGTGNAQQIRLMYNAEYGWYTPGVLLTSNELALGTSEVLVGTGGRLVANTNLQLTSIALQAYGSVEASGNLTLNKDLTVVGKSLVRVDGTLDVANITVQNGATFTTNNVVARNVTLEAGATWNLNALRQSLLDISEVVTLNAGTTITGNALMRDGCLQLRNVTNDSSDITISGTLKLGSDAKIDLTALTPDAAGNHYHSPLVVATGGTLVLEPHDSVLLSMEQVRHLLGAHTDAQGSVLYQQADHNLQIATLQSGAFLKLTNTANEDVPLTETPAAVGLAQGLGYMIDATLKLGDTSESGAREVLLHLSVDAAKIPAYVWDGTYQNHDTHTNLWTMDAGDSWSGDAVYGSVSDTRWSENVYFLETAYSKDGGQYGFHYVNDHVTQTGDPGVSPAAAAQDLTDRAKYVEISGDVWSETITVDVDRVTDMTADQYRRNVGYLFYSLDRTGHITDNGATATNIVKNGTGVLTLATENSFTGRIDLNSGSIFATNQRSLGYSHVHMQDGTSLLVNYTFENAGDSAYRNPVLDNEITVETGNGSEPSSVTIGYNPISVVDVQYDIQNLSLDSGDYNSTSRHWRTLSITGALHGGADTVIKLQGYTSYTEAQIGDEVNSFVFTSMFHIYSKDAETLANTDFSGTIKLENYRNTSPAAYRSSTNLLDDTNSVRGTGAVQLSISDTTLQHATLDLTRQNVLASYTAYLEDGTEEGTGYGRRQTPTNILLLEGDASLAGLNADFLGTIARAQRDEYGVADKKKVEILAASQAYELTSVRTIAQGDYMLTLHSDKEDYNFVYSGVLGGQYAYAAQSVGTITETGEEDDSRYVRIAEGKISLLHTGSGTQYIHSGYLQDLTIGNEVAGAHLTPSGGTVGFHYLDLQGNLTLHSGATLALGVTACQRTADEQFVWDGSSYIGNNVTAQAGKHVNIISSVAQSAEVTDLGSNGMPETHVRDIPVGSTIEGNLTVGNGAYLDFYSRGIEPIQVAEFKTEQDAKTMSDPNRHLEIGEDINPPDNGFMLDITERLILQGEVRVDFAGVEFQSVRNGTTYYLARAQAGIVGSVTQQTISLGNGYFGIIRGLQTYNKLVDSVKFNLWSDADQSGVGTTYTGNDLNSLTDVRVAIRKSDEVGSTDYFFDYYTTKDEVESQLQTLTLTQVSENVYQYTTPVGNTYSTVLLYLTGGDEASAARLNLIDLAYAESPGYIIMTVTNTPPRVWFNQDNVRNPVDEICAKLNGGEIKTVKDGEVTRQVMVTPRGDEFFDGSDKTTIEGVAGFGCDRDCEWRVTTRWTGSSPDKSGWIDDHQAFQIGCRVQFNKYGTARYHVSDGTYTRGDEKLIQKDGEYGLYLGAGDTDWNGMVAEMLGEQFDIVELQGLVQPRSIFVDCETGIHDNSNNLLINSTSGYVNYWFRDAATGDAGCIADIDVTTTNYAEVTNTVYDAQPGQVIAVTLEKTGGGYLRISTQNTYSGGTLLCAGSLIIDNAHALGQASAHQDRGGGDGALHAFGGTTLCIHYKDSATVDLATFANDIKVDGVDSSIPAADVENARRVGFKVTNGLPTLDSAEDNAHFVHLTGAVTAATTDTQVVMTLSGLVDKTGVTGYTVFTLDNLAGYEGRVRLDSFLASGSGEGGDVALRITGDTVGKAVVDLSLNNAYHNALILDMMTPSSGTTYTLGGLSGLVGGALSNDGGHWTGYNSCVVSAKSGSGEKAVLDLNVNAGDTLYAGRLGYGFYHTEDGNAHISSPLALVKDGANTQSVFSGRLDGLTINSGAVQFVKDLTLSGKLSIASGSQLIVGTINNTNYTTTDNAPYSIVVQGNGTLALGSFGDVSAWSGFSTEVADFSADKNPNALLRGGTLTAVTDVDTWLTAAFKNTFTIDTSHYVYQQDIIDDLNALGLKPDDAAAPHTITLRGVLSGSGVVTVTGGGKLVLTAANTFADKTDMTFHVRNGASGGTTLSLWNNNALAKLADRTTGKYSSDSTLEVVDTSTAVVENGVAAQISAARFEDGGKLAVSASSGYSATVGVRGSGNGGDLNMENVTATSNGDQAYFTGLVDNVSQNTVKNNALVTVAGGKQATMTHLTLGSHAAGDNTLAQLESEASLKLKDVVVETNSVVKGSKQYTGVVSSSSQRELVELQSATVNTVYGAEIGDNIDLTPNATLVFTGESAGGYVHNNTAFIYSASAYQHNVGQVIYNLSNFQDCIITGKAGQLFLRMSSTDYETIFAGTNLYTKLLGIFMAGVGVDPDVSEQLITIQAMNGDEVVKTNDSMFYVTYNVPQARANGTVEYGTVFYFVPEPTTATLSLLALAALAARRRRRPQDAGK